MRPARPPIRAFTARACSVARTCSRRPAVAGIVVTSLGAGLLGGLLAPAASSATSSAAFRPLELRTLASVLPLRSVTRPSSKAHATSLAASISALRFTSSGGRLMVRLTNIPAASRCSFSAGTGVGSYAGSFACSGLFAHPGMVRVNTSSSARRWTVRAEVTNGSISHRFAWVISVAGRPPVTTTVPPTTSTVPPTTSTVPPTTSTAPLPGGQPGAESSNWSGYSQEESTGSVSEVGATWTVPTLNCSVTPNGSDAEWVGVDGTQNEEELFQTGINSECQNGQQVSGAWYEDIQGNPPAPSVSLFDVSPGDSVTATVSESSAGSWQYSVTDNTTGQSATGLEPYSGPQNSADWIEEDPSIESGSGSISLSPYADFGTVDFSNLTLDQAVPTLDIESDGIELVQHGSVLATPSQAVGGAFDVTYES